MLVLRADRARGTPFAPRLEALLAPLPDYRVIFAPISERLGKPLTEAFGTLVIASSDPRDVAATFLAVRAETGDAELKRALGAVSWRGGPVGPIGERKDLLVDRFGDPRIFYLPRPSWALLMRPEHLPGQPWLDRLWVIEEVTGEAEGPLAVVVVADTGRSTLELPGLSPIPVPARTTISATPKLGGLVLLGAAEFPDAAGAKAFARALATAQKEATSGLATRLVLTQLKALGLVERLTLKQADRFVTFSTSLTASESLALLDRAAAAARDFFLRRRR
jgi:hypothetical protein